MLEAKRDEFVRLFREFARTYPQTPDGQNHLVAYESGRDQGRRNFEEVVVRRRAEKTLTTAFADPVQQHQGWSFARAKIADEQTLNLDVLRLNDRARLLRASSSPSSIGCI